MAEKFVRVKPPACALTHPEHGGIVVPDPSLAWSVNDPLVKAFPWQFASDDEIGADQEKPPPESVTLAEPKPEKRAYKRRNQ